MSWTPALSILASQIERLTIRLSPALTAQSKSAEANTKRPSMSAELPESIMQRADQIRTNAEIIRDLTERLTF